MARRLSGLSAIPGAFSVSVKMVRLALAFAPSVSEN